LRWVEEHEGRRVHLEDGTEALMLDLRSIEEREAEEEHPADSSND
jgi:hypothetical protein